MLTHWYLLLHQKQINYTASFAPTQKCLQDSQGKVKRKKCQVIGEPRSRGEVLFNAWPGELATGFRLALLVAEQFRKAAKSAFPSTACSPTPWKADRLYLKL